MSKGLHGGYIQTKEIFDEGSGSYRSTVVVWGELLRDPSQNYRRSKKASREEYEDGTVQFVLRYKRGKFIVCKVYAGSPFYNVALRLEEGDVVTVLGEYVRKEYTRKKTGKTVEKPGEAGETKQNYYVSVGFLIPAALLTGDGARITDALNAPPDEFEGVTYE